MILTYANAQDANTAFNDGESIVITNSTSGANGTWLVDELCSGSSVEVLFAKNGASCNCNGNYNQGEDGDFAFQQAGISCTYLPGGALPVTLISFAATKTQSDKVIIHWETGSEINNEGFDIERSHDGKEFHKIGFVLGNGTSFEASEYNFIDRSPIAGTNYYRLKQIDYDGQFEYSEIIQMTRISTKWQINILSNISDYQLSIKSKSSISTLQVFDVSGNRILTKSYIAESKDLALDISSCVSGQYFILFLDVHGRQQVEKFLKF